MTIKNDSFSGKWRTFFRESHRSEIQEVVRSYPAIRSVYVDILELHEQDPELTKALLTHPDHVLTQAEAVLGELHENVEWVNVRVRNHPGLLQINAIRARHIHELVTVEGVATELGPVEATVTLPVYQCQFCNEKMVGRSSGVRIIPPTQCAACAQESALVFSHTGSRFVDSQCITLIDQTTNSDQPRSISVYLTDDLVDSLDDDTSVRTTGIIRVQQHDPSNRFAFYIDANSLEEEPGTRPEEPRELTDVIKSRWEFVTQ